MTDWSEEDEYIVATCKSCGLIAKVIYEVDPDSDSDEEEPWCWNCYNAEV